MMWPEFHCRRHGFTLLEVLVTLTLLGLLLSLAVPTYQGYVQRGNRTEAIQSLLEIATCQERIHARTGTYDTTRCVAETGPLHYRLRIEPSMDVSSMTFRAIADPLAAQQDDRCGSLMLDQSGSRTVSGTAEGMQKCWAGR